MSPLEAGERTNSGAMSSAVLDALAQGIQLTVLTRTRLRRGGQGNKVWPPFRPLFMCCVAAKGAGNWLTSSQELVVLMADDLVGLD